MSNYAIIKIDHNQYLVEEGKEYVVPKFAAEIGKYQPEVLVASVKGKFEAVKPTAKVELEVLEQAKGEKVTSRIYRAKARYRRTTGHRQRVTRFKVKSIK